MFCIILIVFSSLYNLQPKHLKICAFAQCTFGLRKVDQCNNNKVHPITYIEHKTLVTCKMQNCHNLSIATFENKIFIKN
jgi:hypothetical protein